MSLFVELQRRKVFKAGAAYLAVGWLLIQVAATVAPQLNLPEWAPRLITFAILIGFPVVVVMAWVFDVTPEGIKVDTSRAGSTRVFAAASILVALAMGWYFYGQPSFRRGDVVDRSIAVLPFVNMSADPEQEFFSEGIAEELLNRLAQFPDLKVAARTSAFQFKGKNLDVADIGRKLNVSHVLEGSVRKQGDRLRITAQLIDSKSGFHLWSETYERKAEDVFQVQDEISTAIANALEAKINGRPVQAKSTQRVDPEAYDDYLQGRALIAKRVGDSAQRAVEAFDRAIAKDPSYSPAHSGRAFALIIGSYWGDWMSREQAFADAEKSIDQALRLDPGNAEAFMARGTIEAISLRVVAGKADLDRALALAPGNVDVINFYGDMLQVTGDLRGAEAMKRKAMALDPLAFIHPINLSQALVSQGRIAEALQYALRGEALGKAIGANSIWVNVLITQLRTGHPTDAQRTFDANCNSAVPDLLARCRALRIPLLAASGRTADAEHELAGIAADIHEGKVAVQFGGVKGSLALASLYLLAMHDPHRAAPEIRASLDRVQWYGYDKLLVTPEGQKLPEEISSDPDWLAVWNDARLKEFMSAYRANLAKFRSGG